MNPLRGQMPDGTAQGPTPARLPLDLACLARGSPPGEFRSVREGTSALQAFCSPNSYFRPESAPQ